MQELHAVPELLAFLFPDGTIALLHANVDTQ
jgi:hypothetical protein